MKYIKIILILLFFTTTLQAEKMRLAIIDLQPKNVSKDTAEMVSDLLRTELFNTGLFDVIERGEMKTILKEQDFQLSGCTETECAVQMGKLLSARKILVGTVGKLGTKFIINARIVDVELGKMEFGDKATSKSEEELDSAVSEFANKLAGRITGQSPVQQTYQKTENPIKPKPKKEIDISKITTEYRSYEITDEEWTDFKKSDLSLEKYIIYNQKSYGISTLLSIIPVTSGQYYLGRRLNILMGILISFSQIYAFYYVSDEYENINSDIDNLETEIDQYYGMLNSEYYWTLDNRRWKNRSDLQDQIAIDEDNIQNLKKSKEDAVLVSVWIIAGTTILDLIISNIGVSNRKKLVQKFQQFSFQANLFTPNKNIGLAYRF